MNEYSLSQLASQFFSQNYDYLWLKTMLEKARTTKISGSTLITGSSHALNGIYESAWTSAINCSMHSQDIYYDYLCAKNVLESAKGIFTRCFIVMGYYIAYQDLSLSKVSRETMIANVYYPIFHNAHHWDNPVSAAPWGGIGSVPEPMKELCEQAAMVKILELGSYYNEIRTRGTLFDLKGRRWADVPAGERDAMGRYRAADHNRIFEHKATLDENKEILRKFTRLLYLNNIVPVVVITPFTDEYNHYVRQELKEGVLELLDAVPEDIHFVDFNQASDMFDASDFMDTDHLSESGAKKISGILTEMFGK